MIFSATTPYDARADDFASLFRCANLILPAMESATITLKVPEREKREASRILRARGTTLSRCLRACLREIIAGEEDAADLALAKERMKRFKPENCVSAEQLMRRLGITRKELDAAPDDEIG